MKDNFHFCDTYFLGIRFTSNFAKSGPVFLLFEPEQFEVVLERCKEHGLGVFAIEVWKGGCADTWLAEDHGGDPYDPQWYASAFGELRARYVDGASTVHFSATYLEPPAG